jgi:hypothetical protein
MIFIMVLCITNLISNLNLYLTFLQLIKNDKKSFFRFSSNLFLILIHVFINLFFKKVIIHN